MEPTHAKQIVDAIRTGRTSYSGACDAALEKAIDERRSVNREIAETKARLAALEKRAAGLTNLIAQLSGPIEPSYISQEGKAPARATALYNNVVSLFKNAGMKEWSAPDVMKALQQRRVPFNPTQIHNTLAYLAREGKLMRLERGRYLVVPYGFTVETPDDLLNDGDV